MSAEKSDPDRKHRKRTHLDRPNQPQPKAPTKSSPPEGYAEEEPGKRADEPPRRSK